MSRMRSRAFRSSSQGDLTALSQLYIETPVALFEKKTRPALVCDVKPLVEKPRPRVTFTIGSPKRDDDSQSKKKTTKKIDEGYCAFLQSCSLCKKKFQKNGDFYMYGYLRAFCSPDCREDRMALDGFDEEIAKEKISAAMSKRRFGTKRR